MKTKVISLTILVFASTSFAGAKTPFPKSVSGFAFGNTVSQNKSLCEKAGQNFSRGSGSAFNMSVCSDAAVATPLSGKVLMVACKDGKMCSYNITKAVKTTKDIGDTLSILEGKYGDPHSLENFSDAVTKCQNGIDAIAYAHWFFADGNISAAFECKKYTTGQVAEMTIFYDNAISKKEMAREY